MKLIDIFIFLLCVVGLVYFFFDRLKYSNINTYHEKLERLSDIRKKIATIEADNKKFNELIKTTNLDTDFDENFSNKLIDYRNNEEKLNVLKREQREIEKYIKNARMYNKNIGIKL